MEPHYGRHGTSDAGTLKRLMPAKTRKPRRRTIPRVTFEVKWDPGRQRYIAMDDGGVLLGMSAVKGLALGIARTGAMKAAKQHRAAVSVMVEDDFGKFQKQWTFAPPGKGHG
jgi:hypothetical protein